MTLSSVKGGTTGLKPTCTRSNLNRKQASTEAKAFQARATGGESGLGTVNVHLHYYDLLRLEPFVASQKAIDACDIRIESGGNEMFTKQSRNARQALLNAIKADLAPGSKTLYDSELRRRGNRGVPMPIPLEWIAAVPMITHENGKVDAAAAMAEKLENDKTSAKKMDSNSAADLATLKALSWRARAQRYHSSGHPVEACKTLASAIESLQQHWSSLTSAARSLFEEIRQTLESIAAPHASEFLRLDIVPENVPMRRIAFASLKNAIKQQQVSVEAVASLLPDLTCHEVANLMDWATVARASRNRWEPGLRLAVRANIAVGVTSKDVDAILKAKEIISISRDHTFAGGIVDTDEAVCDLLLGRHNPATHSLNSLGSKSMGDIQARFYATSHVTSEQATRPTSGAPSSFVMATRFPEENGVDSYQYNEQYSASLNDETTERRAVKIADRFLAESVFPSFRDTSAMPMAGRMTTSDFMSDEGVFDALLRQTSVMNDKPSKTGLGVFLENFPGSVIKEALVGMRARVNEALWRLARLVTLKKWARWPRPLRQALVATVLAAAGATVTVNPVRNRVARRQAGLQAEVREEKKSAETALPQGRRHDATCTKGDKSEMKTHKEAEEGRDKEGPKPTREEAERVVRRWQRAKSRALGSSHSTKGLDKILGEPMLSEWISRAEQAKNSQKKWQYTYRYVTVEKVESTGKKGTASVTARLLESAVLVDEVSRAHVDCYHSDYTVTYRVECTDGWPKKIRLMNALVMPN